MKLEKANAEFPDLRSTIDQIAESGGTLGPDVAISDLRAEETPGLEVIRNPATIGDRRGFWQPLPTNDQIIEQRGFWEPLPLSRGFWEPPRVSQDCKDPASETVETCLEDAAIESGKFEFMEDNRDEGEVECLSLLSDLVEVVSRAEENSGLSESGGTLGPDIFNSQANESAGPTQSGGTLGPDVFDSWAEENSGLSESGGILGPDVYDSRAEATSGLFGAHGTDEDIGRDMEPWMLDEESLLGCMEHSETSSLSPLSIERLDELDRELLGELFI